jgi:excisionase family DNA binding protein
MNTEYLSLQEAALFLKISKSTLYKKTSLRELPFTKPGGKLILFLKQDLTNYLNSSRCETKANIQSEFLTTLNKES